MNIIHSKPEEFPSSCIKRKWNITHTIGLMSKKIALKHLTIYLQHTAYDKQDHVTAQHSVPSKLFCYK